MAQQDRQRSEIIPLQEQNFTATGVNNEQFLFAGSPAQFPHGILEFSKLSNQNKWVEIPPSQWSIIVGGIGVQMGSGFVLPAGTIVRIVYTGVGVSTTVSGGVIIRDAADATKLASVEMDGWGKGSLFALLATMRRQNGASYDILDLISPRSDDMPHAFGPVGTDAVRAVMPGYGVGKAFRNEYNGGSISLAPGASYISPAVNAMYANRILGSLMHWFVDANPGELILEFNNNPLFPDDTSGQPASYKEHIILNTSNCDSLGLGIPPFQRNRVRWSLERSGMYFRIVITNNGLGVMPGMSFTINMGVF